MKKSFVYLFILGVFGLAACNGQDDTRTEQEVIREDTVGTEYEVEREVQETEIQTDTLTETETVEEGERAN